MYAASAKAAPADFLFISASPTARTCVAKYGVRAFGQRVIGNSRCPLGTRQLYIGGSRQRICYTCTDCCTAGETGVCTKRRTCQKDRVYSSFSARSVEFSNVQVEKWGTGTAAGTDKPTRERQKPETTCSAPVRSQDPDMNSLRRNSGTGSSAAGLCFR